MTRPNPETEVKPIPWGNWYQIGPSNYVYVKWGDTMVTTYSRSYTSVNTPGFPNVSPLPINNHSVVWRRLFPGQLRTEARHPTDKKTWSVYAGHSTGYAIPGPSLFDQSEVFSNEAERKARSRLIASIQRMHANVAQNVGEYRQVQGMFLDTARRFAFAYRSLRRGDANGFLREISISRRDKHNLLNSGPYNIRRRAPELWLQYAYGWSPLCSDIYAVIGNWYKRMEEGYPILAQGVGGHQPNVATSQYVVCDEAFKNETVFKSRIVKYKVWYEIDNSRIANMSSWGLTNPALLAWELLPYSFVVDWFLPVGDWLSSVNYDVGLYFKKGVRIGLAENTYARVYSPRPRTSTRIYSASGTDVYQDRRFVREKLTSFPAAPRPRFDKGGLRGRRVANALALLAQAFNRRV